MLHWHELINTSEYKSSIELEHEIWADVPGYEELYQISNFGRPRSKDRVRAQRNSSGKIINHLYKGKLISIDYSASKFGALNIYDKSHKTTIPIYDLVCQAFGQVYADDFFLDSTSYADTVSDEWVPIPEWSGYQVSKEGNVRRLVNNHYIVLKPWLVSGYYAVRLSINNCSQDKLIHRIVAETFISNPSSKPEVNHKDGNKLNNHVDNLEWVTKSENAKHAWKLGLSYMSNDTRSRANQAAAKKVSVPVYCYQTHTLYPSISAASSALNLKYDQVYNASLHGNLVCGYTFERRRK